MYRKYIHYTAQQLLSDENFLAAEKKPAEESRKIWNQLADQDEYFAHELKVARTILAGTQEKKQKNQLSQKEEQSLWKQIEQSKNTCKKQQNHRIWIRRSITAAACALILCLIINHFIPRSDEELDYQSLIYSNVTQLNNKNQDITLIISDQDKITLTGNDASINYQKGHIEINANTEENKKAEK